MGYHLYSEEDFVCDVGSINGYDSMVTFVKTFANKPNLIGFLTKGTTRDIKETIDEITSIIPRTSSVSIKNTLESLKDGLSKVKEIAIISE